MGDKKQNGNEDYLSFDLTVFKADLLQCVDEKSGARFAKKYGSYARYVTDWNKWLIWNGVYWKKVDLEEE
jgi:hypothetical protein